MLLLLLLLLLCAVRITLRWSDDCSYSCRFSLLTQACMMFCLISTPYGVFPYYTQKSLLPCSCLLDCILFLHLSIIFQFHTSFFHIKRKSSIFQQLLMISKEIPCWLLSTTTAPSSEELHTTQHHSWLCCCCMALKWNCLSFFFYAAAAAVRHHARPPASTPFFATRTFASLCLLLSTTEC